MRKCLFLSLLFFVMTISSLMGQITPMIQSEWNTVSPWNGYCPYMETVRANAGTGALSAAKIMKFWNYPDNGSGTANYVDDDLGDISQSLNFEFDWERMSNVLNRTETQLLIAIAGYAIESDWETDYTTTTIEDIQNALENNFSYSSSMELHDLATTSIFDWRQMINQQLALGRPVLYQGYAESVDRYYQIIIDGLTADNRYTYLTSIGTYEHFTTNLTDLVIDGNLINVNNQKMLINIVPSTIDEYDESFETGFSNNNWYFQGNSSWTIASNEAYDGTHSARPLNIGHNQTSSMLIDLSVPESDNISFFIKPSCEAPTVGQYDRAVFYINGVEQDEWYGVSDWTYASYPLSPGIYQFKWSYIKDGSVVDGDDTVYLDAIDLPSGETPLNPPQNLTAVVSQNNTIILDWQAPDSFERELQGYIIYRDFSELTRSYNPNVTTYTDGNVSNGSHDYAVRAIYNSGLSDYSNSASIVINIAYPPVNLAYEIYSAEYVYITWQPSPLVGDNTPDSYNHYLNGNFISNSTQLWKSLILDEGEHLFYVTAVYDDFESEPSNMLNIIVGSIPPPSNVTATTYDGNNVHLEWNTPAATTITGYEIYRNGDLLTEITSENTNDYYDEDLENGTYTYTLKSVYNSMTSGHSLPVTVDIMVLLPPSNLQATQVNEVSVQLAWNYTSGSELLDYFKVYRNGQIISSVYNTSNPTYFDYNLANGSYDYQVTAVYQGLESDFSETESIEIEYLYPPRNFQAEVEGSVVELTWDIPAIQGGATRGLQNYKLYQDDVFLLDINNTQTTSYSVSDLENGSYTFYLLAEYSSGLSEMVQAQAIVEVLYPPQNLSYNLEGQDVTISWEAGSLTRDFIQYHVYRNGIDYARTSNTFFIDEDLNNGFYEYTVQAEYSSGFSQQSSPVSFELEIPYPVTNVDYSTEDNNIILSWERPAFTERVRTLVNYEIYRNDISLAYTTDLTYTDTNLVNGDYQYYIIVHYSNLSSEASETINVNLMIQYPIEDLSSQVTDKNNISLAWERDFYSGNSVLDFQILKNGLVVTTTNESNYFDENLADGAYTYSIIANYSNGPSEAIESNLIQIEYPYPVSDLEAVASNDTINLSWDYPQAGSPIFNIYRNNRYLTQTTEVSFSDVNLVNGNYSYYIITSNNSDSGESEASETVVAEVSVTYPVTGLVANVVDDSINLTWNAPATSSRAFSSYSLFVNDQLYQANISSESFTINDLANGSYSIYVIANYTNGDSEPSNTVNPIVEVQYSPINLTLSTDDNNVQLNWQAPEDTTGLIAYNVYRNGSLLLETTTPSYIDTDLINDTYTYSVRSVYTSGQSAPLSSEAILIDLFYSVIDLNVQISNSDFTLSWQDNPLTGSSTIEYQVYMNDQIIATTSDTSYLFSGNANGSYDLAVKAIYDTGQSEISESVTAIIDVHYPAQNLVASVESNNVTLSWEINSFANNVIDYIILRDGQEIASTSNQTYIDSNLYNGSYEYQVQAQYLTGLSDISDIAYAQVEVLYAPNNLTLSIQDNNVSLNWDQPNEMYRDFIGYKLYKNNDLISSQTELNYTDSDLINSSYSYFVTAEYSSGESVSSNHVEANIEVLYPANNVSLNVNEDDVLISWDFNPMAGDSIIDYTLYRNGQAVASTSNLSYLDESLANGIYDYSIAVNYQTGSSEQTEEMSVLVEVLYSPENFTYLIDDNNNVLLSWEAAPTSSRAFLGYKLYRDEELIFFDESALTYYDENLINDSYEYKLEAIYSTGVSQPLYLNIDIEVLYPVVNFVGNLSETEIELTWEENDYVGDSIISYSLYRNNELYSVQTEAYYLDSALANGIYEYYVIVNYNTGSSPASENLSFNVEITYPVTNLTAQVTADVVDLAWDLPVNSPRALLSYNIYRDGDLLANTQDLSYSDIALANGTYSYFVTALYDAGESEASNSVEVLVEVLYPVENLVSSVDSSNVILSWDEIITYPRSFINYLVYRDDQEIAQVTSLTYMDENLANGSYNYYVKANYSTGISEASNTTLAIVEVLYPASDLTGDLINDQVTLNWQTPSELYRDFLGYNIYRNNELIESTMDNYFVDSALANGDYSYYITANYSSGESSPTNSVHFHVEITYPVTTLNASVDENNVTLAWELPATSALPRAFRGYLIYRNGAIANVIDNPETLTWTDLSLANGDYDYYVKAVYDAGISIESNTVSVNIYIAPELLAPTNLQLFVENDSDVHLTWDIPTGDPIAYMIFKDNVLVTVVTENFYWDYSLANGSYQYYVKAEYTEGISSPSTTVVANIASADVPSNLNATISNGNDITLSWDAPNNSETAFIINRNGQEIAYLSDVSQTSYTDLNLTNQSYTYTIRAVYNNLVSDLSNPVYAQVEKVHTPMITSYSALDNSISITWEDLSSWGQLVDYTVFKNGQEITNTSNNYYDEVDLSNGLYDYTVRANFDFASSDQSQPVNFEILLPQLVNNLTRNIQDDDLMLTWDLPEDTGLITSYKVFRNQAVIAETQNSYYLDTELANGSYDYQVMTYYNDTIENPITENLQVDFILPYPVRNLTYNVDNNNIVLSWLEPLDSFGLLNYEVYKNDDLIANLDSSANQYTDIQPENGLYQYSVKSVYQGDVQDLVQTELISFIIPVSPNNLTISATEETVDLVWDFTGNDYEFTSFEVYNNSDLLGSTSENSFALDLANGDYNFSVKTIYSSVESEASEILAYQLLKTYPLVNVSYSIIEDDLELTWDLPTDTFGLDSITLMRQTSDRLEITLPATATSYLDENIDNGLYNYSITANYNSPIQVDKVIQLEDVSVINAQPVTDLAIDAQENDLTLSWNHPQDLFAFSTYHVYQNTTLVGTTEDNTFVLNEQANGDYSFMIRSVYENNNEIDSAELDYTLIIAYPAQNASIETIDNDIIISWENPSDIFGLDSFTLLNNEAIIGETNSLTYTIVNANNGVYNLSLIANYSNDDTAAITLAEDYVKLTPYQVVSVDVSFANPVPEISWVESSDTYGLIGYNVYSLTSDQITDPDTWTVIDTLVTTASIDDDVSELVNGSYYWAVTSVYRDELNDITFYSEPKLSNIITDNNVQDAIAITKITGNYPNPFNPVTRINYQIASDSHVSLSVYNLKGQLVKKLVNENLQAGKHSIIWQGNDDNGKSVASGMYFFKLTNNGIIKVHKAILMK